MGLCACVHIISIVSENCKISEIENFIFRLGTPRWSQNKVYVFCIVLPIDDYVIRIIIECGTEFPNLKKIDWPEVPLIISSNRFSINSQLQKKWSGRLLTELRSPRNFQHNVNAPITPSGVSTVAPTKKTYNGANP